MSTTDSPWGDTGFGSSDDGFAPTPTSSQPTPESSTPSNDATHERVRVESISALPPIAPPPTPVTSRSGRPLVWIGIIALLVLVLAVVGVDWYLTSRSIEEQAFIATDAEMSQQEKETAEPIDADQQSVVETPTRDDTSARASVAHQEVASGVATAKQAQPASPPTPTVAPTSPSRQEPTPHEERQPITRTPTANSNGPAWVVQVFASPSRDDAEEWLQQLREQRIPDGYIVEQKVKGQSWYRVRFGQFATRNEAEQAAVNRGFAQPWIARVR